MRPGKSPRPPFRFCFHEKQPHRLPVLCRILLSTAGQPEARLRSRGGDRSCASCKAYGCACLVKAKLGPYILLFLIPAFFIGLIFKMKQPVFIYIYFLHSNHPIAIISAQFQESNHNITLIYRIILRLWYTLGWHSKKERAKTRFWYMFPTQFSFSKTWIFCFCLANTTCGHEI